MIHKKFQYFIIHLEYMLKWDSIIQVKLRFYQVYWISTLNMAYFYSITLNKLVTLKLQTEIVI